MKATIPESLKLEHDELHHQLATITHLDGKIGEAAHYVSKLMHPHFIAEEEFAIPPLGILPKLIQGNLDEDWEDVLRMTDRLKTELPKMLEEHNSIVAALNNLIKIARDENNTEVVEFAEKLKMHARTEEQVTYPTALLIGEYLKLKLN